MAKAKQKADDVYLEYREKWPSEYIYPNHPNLTLQDLFKGLQTHSEYIEEFRLVTGRSGMVLDDMKALKSMADGSEKSLMAAAKVLLIPAPTEALSYYQLAMVDAVDLQRNTTNARTTVETFHKAAVAHLSAEESKYERMQNAVNALSEDLHKKKLQCGTLAKPDMCPRDKSELLRKNRAKQDRGSSGGSFGSGTGRVAH